jgi:GAF domain-containing protein
MIVAPLKGMDAETNLRLMTEVIKATVEGERDVVAALANCSAVIKSYLDDINWAGFYVLKGTELVLGPFQGLPACTRIAWGKGVCGRAALEAKPLIVGNVHEFAGHIACDSASNSEIVIPLFQRGTVYGVLDVDSPLLNRFSALEAEYLGRVAGHINAFLESQPGPLGEGSSLDGV